MLMDCGSGLLGMGLQGVQRSAGVLAMRQVSYGFTTERFDHVP
jgi:hypothetical protein